MKKSKIAEVHISPDYLIHKNIEKASFSDSFQLASENLNDPPEPKDLMIAFFLSFPKSFKALLTMREFFAKRLGLKTAEETKKESRLEKLYKFKGNIGEKVALFEVQDKSENELLTGQNDSHLDFKLSFLSFKKDNKVILELATTVIINNSIGKLYFRIVKPFHKFYLKRIISKMEKQLLNKSW